jgi:phosphate-selective porin OprO/OprP
MRRATAAGALLVATVLIGTPRAAAAQPPSQPPTLDDTIDAAEGDNVEPVRKLVRWNEYDGRLFTLRLGGGVLFDYAGYSQDADSKKQFELTPETKVRDARVLLKGRLKFKREVTWSCGLMYDGATDSWLVRETGVMFKVPEIFGYVFIGRTKEGFSLNKVMVGYAGWTMERAPINDATVPILADGIKWLGYARKAHLIWNLGFYGDWLSKGQTFSTYSNQVSGRIAWVPIMSETKETVLHIGVSGRYGKPLDGELRLRSRPEAFPAPYFVDTGEFPATGTTMTALEAYYRPGPWLFGTEYFVQSADAPTVGNPVTHGGDVVATWLVTGETRAYNTRGGFFNQVSPRRTLFEGGPGAWELVGRVSYIDLDSHGVSGGRFWRYTAMVNWYLSDHVRLEFNYGYGTLDRFGLVGNTQFFQSRLQLQL